MAKKYVWLKLKKDFFQQRAIKKLRKIAGGDTYTIIYLKLQLLSLDDEGKLFYEGVEENFAEEMALALDEDPENVKVVLMFLEKNGLLETVTENEFVLPETVDCIGSETAAAERMRKMRNTKAVEKIEVKEKKRNIVTPMLQDVTEELQEVTNCYTEKEKEKEKDTTTKIDILDKKESEQQEENSSSSFSLIKNMLEQHGISNNTKLNIMVLVRDENITPERVSEVLKAAQVKHWQEGAIYTALRDKWAINLDTEQQEKQKQRERSAKIDEQNKEFSQAFQAVKDKVNAERQEKEELLNYFNSLSKETQTEINNIALQRAKEKYPPVVYVSMFKTLVIYEVIREYKAEKES
ncbi:phage replisome organizer N-terminal domain-containing protein [Fusobacterium perfoetens]|uniref:phage replisome organizer N-terminal domain-containing protein n=1 Tax=Fusobacterium perfoetens TaxID=852 RepID=UPI001F349DFE|nr:phage replisome organizer N-terminal domain-containing protein [Fusobacterium perfoetens]MCF2625274.1 phage replisome organizer N-terminal domain-containing protein [Fusobacterium perfoetens]